MAEEAFYAIRDAIKCGKPEFLEFTHLSSEDIRQLIKGLFYRPNRLEEHRFRIHFSPLDNYLRVVMPSYSHETAHSWLVQQYADWRANGLINAAAADTLTIPGSPRVTNFMGSYTGGIKEPDFAFVPLDPSGVRRDFPSVVLEAGWTSTITDPQRDRNQWHDGSNGRVLVVVLVKLSRPRTQDRVRVTLEVSHITSNTSFTITKRDIFPIPEGTEPDPTLTIQELFGGQCPPDHPPTTALPLSIDKLRRVVEAYLITDRYRPA